MLQTISSIILNEQLTEDCWRLTLDSLQIAAEAKPGQFINIRIRETNDPLFRRPFSISRRVVMDNGSQGFQIIYRVVGEGTQIMATLKSGDKLDIIGPLGHGFEVAQDKKVHILVAGGIGSAALFLLGEEISEKANQHSQLKILIGAQTKDKLLLEKEFRKLNGEVLTCTDDGTSGYCGTVTKMLQEVRENNSLDCAIYACGPEPMFKALSIVCRQYLIPAQVCMERHMLCGIGACLVCVCKVSKNGVLKHRDLKYSHIQFLPEKDAGYALVCKDGPVFNLDEVIFDE